MDVGCTAQGAPHARAAARQLGVSVKTVGRNPRFRDNPLPIKVGDLDGSHMKFLVLWRMELSPLSAEMAAAVARMPRYAKPLEQRNVD